MTEKRQFIAGACCPECGQQDKVQRVDNGAKVWMECVRCGMTRDLDEPAQPIAKGESTDGQPVTIMPPGKHRLH